MHVGTLWEQNCSTSEDTFSCYIRVNVIAFGGIIVIICNHKGEVKEVY